MPAYSSIIATLAHTHNIAPTTCNIAQWWVQYMILSTRRPPYPAAGQPTGAQNTLQPAWCNVA